MNGGRRLRLLHAVEASGVLPEELATHLWRGLAQPELDLLLHGRAVQARRMGEVGLEQDVVDRDLVEQAPAAPPSRTSSRRTPGGRSTPTGAAPTRWCGPCGPRGSCGRPPRARRGSSRCRSRPTRPAGRGTAAGPRCRAGRRPGGRSSGRARSRRRRRSRPVRGSPPARARTRWWCRRCRGGGARAGRRPGPRPTSGPSGGRRGGAGRSASGSPVNSSPRWPVAAHRSISATAASSPRTGWSSP